MDCLLLFRFLLYLLPFSLFLLPQPLSFAGKMRQEGCSTSHAAGQRLGVSWPSWNASAQLQLVKLCTPQGAWLLKRLAFPEGSGRIDLLLAQKYELLQNNSRLLGCEKVMETRAKFHFNWIYTFSAMLSSLRNWANNDRYRLRSSTPAQLCWSSNRLQPLQNFNLIKFTIIQPSTLNHDRNLWNIRGAPDETTCFAGFFRCPSALILFLHEIV